MAKNLGTFQFASNFQVKTSEALDPRMVAESKADLINKDNWPSDGDIIYVYKGLIVDCGEDGVYRLINPDLVLDKNYLGWERIDSGGIKIDNIFTYKGSISNYELLLQIQTHNKGDVYNIENDFIITTPLGDQKKYPSGTNVAWNGVEWDPLSGSIDLSSYASKEEVSLLRTNVSSNFEQIGNLTIQLQATNLELSNKLDKVEGSTLITNEKLELIETNANRIVTLQESNNNITSRLSIIDDEIDSNIKPQLTNHAETLTALVNANSNNSTKINDNSNRLNLLEEANNKQDQDITNTIISLSNINTTLENQLQEMQLLKASIPSAGNGLNINNNKLEIKLNPSTDNRLTISNTGLMVDLSNDGR